MKKPTGIVAEFYDLLESPQNRLVELAVSQGRIPVAYTCSLVPEPLLMADRLFPLRLHAPGVAGTEIADNYMSLYICSYTRSILEFAFDDRYDLVQGWVCVPSCAHMQRLFDNLRYLKNPVFTHTIDVPQKATPHTTAWLAEELAILRDRITEHFGVDMSDASLRKAMNEWNEFVREIKAVGDLRKKENPPLTGAEFHAMLMAALVSPKDLILPLIRKFREEVEHRPGTGNHRARLMVVGGHLQDPEFIRVIESQGGLVVADRFCTGSIPGMMPVDVNGSDPVMALAEHTFRKTLCPRMMEDFDRRLNMIIDTVKEYRVDGVVLEIIKFCDHWGLEAVPLVEALRKKGIPVLRLEREYRLSSEGQLSTRVQAFLESMRK